MNSGGLIEAPDDELRTESDLQFPPVNSGGLIEACETPSGYTGRSSWFPPVNSGGLIEAAGSTTSPAGARRTFPPVNSGGLIEASPPAAARWCSRPAVSAGEFRRPH